MFTVKLLAISNLDPVSSYDVQFLCILYGRKARIESYNFRVEKFSEIGPETASKQQFQWQPLEVTRFTTLNTCEIDILIVYLSQKNLVVVIYIATIHLHPKPKNW